MLSAHTDGGSRGNPGPGAYAWLLFRNDRLCAFEYGCLGDATTNNQAEYHGMLRLFQYLEGKKIAGDIEVRSDSQLVVKQLLGEFRGHDPVLFEAHRQLLALMARQCGRVTPRWVPRAHNRCADLLVNEALDKGTAPTISENTRSPLAFRLRGLYKSNDSPGVLSLPEGAGRQGA